MEGPPGCRRGQRRTSDPVEVPPSRGARLEHRLVGNGAAIAKNTSPIRRTESAKNFPAHSMVSTPLEAPRGVRCLPAWRPPGAVPTGRARHPLVCADAEPPHTSANAALIRAVCLTAHFEVHELLKLRLMKEVHITGRFEPARHLLDANVVCMGRPGDSPGRPAGSLPCREAIMQSGQALPD